MKISEERIGEIAEELKDFEIESYNLNNGLTGWHTEIWMDLSTGDIDQSGQVSQNSWTERDQDDYTRICCIDEKYFWDYFPELDSEKEIEQEEIDEIILNGLCDARFYDFIEDIVKWINTKDGYKDSELWLYHKPRYEEYLY